MSRPRTPAERPVYWIGSLKRDLLGFPDEVVDDLGYALGVVQFGGTPPTAKPWKGEGPRVFELVEDFRGDTSPSGLHGAFRESDLRPPLLPEEVSLEGSDGEAGH